MCRVAAVNKADRNPVGALSGLTLASGARQTRSYDRAGRLNTITNLSASNTVAGGFTYVRDANGNPTGIDVSGPRVIVSESQRLTYDNADRLTRACYTTAVRCVAASTQTWSYDRVGNRLTEKIGTAAVSTYTYDTADQLSSVTGPGAASFTYNANGD